MAKTKKFKKRVLTVRTMINSDGYGYLHDGPNKQHYYLHASVLELYGFDPKVVKEDSVLVADGSRHKDGRWQVTKVHSICSSKAVPEIGSEVVGTLIFNNPDHYYCIVELAKVGSVHIRYKELVNVSEEAFGSMPLDTKLKFTFGMDCLRRWIGTQATPIA